MLEPTQYRLNGSGPEHPHGNGVALGFEWRTVLRGFRNPAGASSGTGGQLPELRSNRSEKRTKRRVKSGAVSMSCRRLRNVLKRQVSLGLDERNRPRKSNSHDIINQKSVKKNQYSGSRGISLDGIDRSGKNRGKRSNEIVDGAW